MSFISASEPILKTPFFDCAAELNTKQRWVAWDCFFIADVFSDMHREYRAIRESAAAIDMSPLSKFDIIGPDSKAFLNYLVTRDISKQQVGQILYTPWCNPEGKLVNDGVIFKHSEDHFRISCDPQLLWLSQNALSFDVNVVDVSLDFGILSIQGPKSRQKLEQSFGQSLSGLKFSRFHQFQVSGLQVFVMRQGFTGELGYELWVKAPDGTALWEILFEGDSSHENLLPAGFYSHDVARMEAGLIIPGPDYTGAGTDNDRGAASPVLQMDIRSPFEAGLNRFVHFDKTEFIGKAALLKEWERRTFRRMKGLVIDWSDLASVQEKKGLQPVCVPHPIWIPLDVTMHGKNIGRATSITWSPAIGNIAGFAFLDEKFAISGQNVTVEMPIGDEFCAVRGKVADIPFLKPLRGK